MGRLLGTHKPPLVTIEALEREIPYYVTQMRIYAETTPDAAPEVIAGLGGMRYGLAEGSLKVRRRIWALYHPSDLVEEEDTNDPGIMGLNTLTAEGGWSEDYIVNGQSYVSSDELFFTAPDYEEIRLCEDT